MLSAIFYWLQLTTTGWIGHRLLLLSLRRDMFAHLQKLSLRFYDNNEVGRVMSRVTSDVTSLQDLMTSGFLTIIGDVAGIVLSIGFLMYFDVRLALVTFTVVPILVVTMAVWQSYSRRAFIRVRQAIAIVNANLQENVSGVRVIQSLSREDENAKRFDNINQQNWHANVNAGRLSAAVTPAVEVIVAIGMSLVIGYGGYRALHGEMTVAALIGFALQLQLFFDPMRDLVLQYTQLQRAMAGGERVFEVLDTKPEFEDAPDAIDIDNVDGRVDFNHVTFRYVDDVPVLVDIDLHVEPGETIAFVGQTGAGKTTMTALLPRFYDVTEGSIEIDGIDVRKISHKSLSRRMGLVLQEPFLFSGTVAENIRYGREDATDEEIEEAAQTVGAHDFIMRLDERLRDVPARARHEPVGRSAAAHQLRARDHRAAAHPDPRRGDGERRHADRSDHPARAEHAARRTARRSSSRTACRRSATPTGSSCWSTGASSSRGSTTTCWRSAAATPTSTR